MADTLDFVTISRREGLLPVTIELSENGAPLDCSNYTARFEMRAHPGELGNALLGFAIGADSPAGSSIAWVVQSLGTLSLKIAPADVADRDKFPLSDIPPNYFRLYFCGVRISKTSDGAPVLPGQVSFRAALQEDVVES